MCFYVREKQQRKRKRKKTQYFFVFHFGKPTLKPLTWHLFICFFFLTCSSFFVYFFNQDLHLHQKMQFYHSRLNQFHLASTYNHQRSSLFNIMFLSPSPSPSDHLHSRLPWSSTPAASFHGFTVIKHQPHLCRTIHYIPNPTPLFPVAPPFA